MTTNLADLETFLGKLDAAIVVKSFNDTTNLNAVAGDKVALIKSPPDLFATKDIIARYSWAYPVVVRGSTEAIAETLFQTLITNIKKLITYQAIAGYTRPTKLASIKTHNVGKYERKLKGKTFYHYEITIILEWDV